MTDAELHAYRLERERFQSVYDGLLRWASEGPFQDELIRAKDLFFEKIGRTHELNEDIFEAATMSFHEWYLFQFPTKRYGKAPAIVKLTQGEGDAIELDVIQRALMYRWSLFEVDSLNDDGFDLRDLLVGVNRKVVFDRAQKDRHLWRVEKNQLVQARLFPRADQSEFFLSHFWLHTPSDEVQLKTLAVRCGDRNWGDQSDFLMSALWAVIRTYGLKGQVQVMQKSHWMYRELEKKYSYG